MKKMVNFEKPEKMPAKVLKNIETLKKMKDEDIDYSDIPPLDKTQLAEMAKIVMGKKRMPSITLRLPANVLDQYKELGKGYTSVMSHILCKYVHRKRKYAQRLSDDNNSRIITTDHTDKITCPPSTVLRHN